MARQGENTSAPSYTKLERKVLRRDYRRGTDWRPAGGDSGAIPAAGRTVTKADRKTGRK